MQIVQASDLPIEEKQSGGREGRYRRRMVMRGKSGDPGNFSLILYYQDGSFRSPRHRHNFDQYRYQIEGDADFHRNGVMKPGVLGYFPEGAYYGPQSGPPHTVAVLQFGGASGSGYLGADQTRGGREALAKVGAFEKGVFRRNPGVEGPKDQDSYEAVWEHVHRRRLVYPKPQYEAPIMIDTNESPWAPLEGDGVTEKILGTFTHCRMRAARYRLDAGAQFVAEERGIYLVLSGTGAVSGQPLKELTTVYLDEGEAATFAASEPTDVLLMGLPSVSLMTGQVAARDA
jgi:hypothetical protein